MSTLLILGASARAAAGSARRAGYSPWCADLFADADLRRFAPVIRCPVSQYPSVLLETIRSAPDVPWIYTGALENHPNLIRALAELRPLWGNGPNALLASRSPFIIEQCLREASLPTAEVRAANAEFPANGRWLRKPLSGSAGNGIAFADASSQVHASRHYFQQYVEGVPMSAVFARRPSETLFLGVTEQLIGEPWLNAPPFRYAGNIGPVEMSAELRRDLGRVGSTIGERCGLLGLFGVDFLLHEDRPWIVEVNPRYTASIEVIELATGLKSISLHCSAFGDRPISDAMGHRSTTVMGKAIWYAPRRIVMPAYGLSKNRFSWRLRLEGDDEGISCADVPSPGEVIEQGWPVLTVFARGLSRSDCLRELRERVDWISERVSV